MLPASETRVQDYRTLRYYTEPEVSSGSMHDYSLLAYITSKDFWYSPEFTFLGTCRPRSMAQPHGTFWILGQCCKLWEIQCCFSPRMFKWRAQYMSAIQTARHSYMYATVGRNRFITFDDSLKFSDFPSLSACFVAGIRRMYRPLIVNMPPSHATSRPQKVPS